MIDVEDHGRVRLLTINRPRRSTPSTRRTTTSSPRSCVAAGEDAGIAVAVITGTGRSFCAGTDVKQMPARNEGGVEIGAAGFVGFLAALLDFPKPLLIAVNGLAIGIGATMLGLADLVLVSSTARLRYPFTELGVAPEAASSYLLPRPDRPPGGAGHCSAREWLSAERGAADGHRLAGLRARRPAARDAAVRRRRWPTQPIESLVTTKQLIVAPYRAAAREAMQRENQAFAELLGGPANQAALDGVRGAPQGVSVPRLRTGAGSAR